MLAIRYLRSGKKNHAFYRIVLTESSKPPKSGFIKALGWYDPHTKKTSLNKEEILKWLDLGAIASNSVSKLLMKNEIKHKGANFIADKPKVKKSKGEKKKPAEQAKKEETETTEPQAQEKPGQQAKSEEVAITEDKVENKTEQKEK